MSIDDTARRIYRFSEFSLDLDREALFQGDHQVHLRPKSFAVLTILLEHPGRLVTKTMLHDAAWKGSVVTDDSLAHCIADIRRALGDSGFEMIRTVPRRGYIFDNAVSQELVSQQRVARERRHPALRAASITAVVLVATVLLVGAWRSDTGPDRSNAGVTQTRSATGADASHERKHARSEYQRGRYFFGRRGDGDLEHAEASFKRAIELDPSFGAAWTGLAGVYIVKYGSGSLSSEEALPLLGDATRRAISLDPQSAEANIRRASYYLMLGDTANARRHEETAIALAPNDLLVLGVRAGRLAKHAHFEEAIELQRRAILTDPTSAVFYNNLVWYLLAAGRVAEAAMEAEQYRALTPSGVNNGGDLFVDILILQGKYQQALAPTHGIASNSKRNRNLAIIYHELGQREFADAALARLISDDDEMAALHVVEVLAQRGDVDQAIRLLPGIVTTLDGKAPGGLLRHRSVLSLLSPYLIELRSDERWQALHAQVLEAYEYSAFVARADVGQASVSEE